jgi:hypothetical protein
MQESEVFHFKSVKVGISLAKNIKSVFCPLLVWVHKEDEKLKPYTRVFIGNLKTKGDRRWLKIVK